LHVQAAAALVPHYLLLLLAAALPAAAAHPCSHLLPWPVQQHTALLQLLLRQQAHCGSGACHAAALPVTILLDPAAAAAAQEPGLEVTPARCVAAAAAAAALSCWCACAWRLLTAPLYHASSTELLPLTCRMQGQQMQHPRLLLLLAWQLTWTYCCYMQ
jgi:hypothetical protein